MTKHFFLIIICLLSGVRVNAQIKVTYTPYLQLGGLYCSSQQVTCTGAGPGIGLSVGINKHFLVKSDLNLYWINGNTGSFRLASGYKRNGLWAPALYLGITSIFGSRTELLLEDGARPINPVFSFGLQLCPLRFENEKGFVSVSEIAYGYGSYNGKNIELSILSLGIKF